MLQLPPRKADAHKGDFGHLLLIAGSQTMSGAARLSGWGALRGGVGLLTIATPREAWPIVAAENPAWMTLPLDSTNGMLAQDAVPDLLAACDGKSAIALGPGLGSSDAVREVVHAIYSQANVPMVLDADGLNAMVGVTNQFGTNQFVGATDQIVSPAPRVWTPHPGEFARLLGCSTAEVQSDRQHLAETFAAKHRIVLLLKGSRTIITDGTTTVINTTGNSGMARGGSGDVLTGLIGALLAQRMPPFEATRLAAHLHGLAGDIAAERMTKYAMLVTDLIDAMPVAWARLEATLE